MSVVVVLVATSLLQLAGSLDPAAGAGVAAWPDERSIPIYSATRATDAVRAAFAATPPAVAPDSSPATDVFLTPHQDDETLTYGSLLSTATQAGRNVWLVTYTTGGGSGVCTPVDGSCTNPWTGWSGRPIADFVSARDDEQARAAAALGVPADHLSRDPYRDGSERTPDAAVTVESAALVLARWHAAYPAATLWVMSWLDLNPDHALMGEALRAAVAAGLVPSAQARFAMAAAYNHERPRAFGMYPWVKPFADLMRIERGAPAAPRWVGCSTNICRNRVVAAIAAYQSPYAIGWMSVNAYMRAALADPDHRVITHDAATATYAGGTTMRASRMTDGRLFVRGRCSIEPLRPANAAVALSAGETPVALTAAWRRGYVLVAYVAPGGVRAFSRRPVSTDGTYRAVLPAQPASRVQARCTGLAHVDAPPVVVPIVP